jgi:hypothetical protein
MDGVDIFDNFLTEDQLLVLHESIITGKWNYINEINGYSHWKIDNVNEEKINFIDIINKIENEIKNKIRITNTNLISLVFGQDEFYKTIKTDKKTYLLFIYLTNIEKSWVETAGGHLYLKRPNQQFSILYEPIYNRAILFDSSYIFKNCSFSRFTNNLKAYLSIEFEII